VLLGGIATYKLSRLIAKDKVTSFVRARLLASMFTAYAIADAAQLANSAAEKRS
jgi:hypothetical protein